MYRTVHKKVNINERFFDIFSALNTEQGWVGGIMYRILRHFGTTGNSHTAHGTREVGGRGKRACHSVGYVVF